MRRLPPDLLVQQGAWIMTLDAIRDGDLLRLQAALRHLALVDELYGWGNGR